jgi:hypothetical protein
MSTPYYGKSIAKLIVPKELQFPAAPIKASLPSGRFFTFWDGDILYLPQWWDDICSDGTKLLDVEVKDGVVTVDNGTSTTHYKTFGAVPKWVQDKVLKLSMMPEMHMPIVGLGRRCRDGRYRVLVPAHMLSRSGPKPRKKWERV